MLNTFWLLFEFLQMSLIEFPTLSPWKKWTIGILTLCIASYGYVSDRRDNQKTDATLAQMNSLNERVSHLQSDNSGLYKLVSYVAANQATLMKPGLKKQALELASTLLDRSTAILVLAGQHGPRDNQPPGPPSLQYQKEVQRVQEALKQSRADAAKLLSDYKNTYAQQVLTLRQEFIQQGQGDWKDEQYYLNPIQATPDASVWTTIPKIQQIGSDLFRHANQLN
jgi:hypothetical protein